MSTTHLSEILVHLAFRGQGIGSALVRAFLADQPPTSLWVVGFEENSGFFERFGLKRRELLGGLVGLEQRLEDRARRSQTGRRTVKIAPPPCRFRAAICPPWASTRALAIASPNPEPPVSRVRALSER